jgi:hypothetical protein
MNPIDWDNLPLGQVADEELARDLKARGFSCDRSTVTRHRRRRSIPRFTPLAQGDDVDWSTMPLGIINDRKIAEHLGIQTSVVQEARNARHIPPARKHLDVNWDEQPLGEILDICIAARLGVTHVTVLRQRADRGIPVAPQNDRNLLLSLVYKTPGQDTGWYAERLGRPAPSVRRDLNDFLRQGFVARSNLHWVPIRTPVRERNPFTTAA